MLACLQFLLFFKASGLIVSKIPSTNTPPQGINGPGSVYDELNSRLILFGGYSSDLRKYLSYLHTFDLANLTWDEIYPDSDFIPPGIAYSKLAIYSNTLYVFYGKRAEGVNGNIYSFNLYTYIWKVEYLEGDSIKGRFNYAFTSFEYKSTTYAAIFGGLTNSAIDNSLFL